MWKISCSEVWQRIPSTGEPVAAADRPASGGAAAGIGTPSTPLLPGLGGGCSGPSALIGPVVSRGVLARGPAGPPPLVTASTIAMTAPIARTAAPAHRNSRRCLAFRASRARISATLALAISRFLLALDTDSVPFCQGHRRGGGRRSPRQRRVGFSLTPPPRDRAYWTVRPRNCTRVQFDSMPAEPAR